MQLIAQLKMRRFWDISISWSGDAAGVWDLGFGIWIVRALCYSTAQFQVHIGTCNYEKNENENEKCNCGVVYICMFRGYII